MPTEQSAPPRAAVADPRLARARHALVEAETLPDVARVVDYAEALKQAAKRAGLSEEAQRDWALFSLEAQRKAGQLLAATPKHNGGRPSETPDSVSAVSTLQEILGTATAADAQQRSKRWQDVAAVPDRVWEQYTEIAAEPTRSGLLHASKVGVLNSSQSPEWYTPKAYVEAARGVMGGIDLDPASCAEANAVVGATRFYDAAADGLAHDWHGRVFLNPPYGQSAPKGNALFVPKLIAEHRAGRVTAAVLLTSAHGTETDWFGLLWEHTICFTDHRIGYWNSDGVGAPTFGSALTYLGPDRDRFADRFAEFGAVVVAYRGAA
jgi:hypothetical protein